MFWTHTMPKVSALIHDFAFTVKCNKKIKEFILSEIFLFRHSPDIVPHIFEKRNSPGIVHHRRDQDWHKLVLWCTWDTSDCQHHDISTFTKMRRLPNLVEFYLFLVFWVLCKILQNCCVNVKRSFDWATFSLPFYWKLPIPLSSYRKTSAAFAITSFQVEC